MLSTLPTTLPTKDMSNVVLTLRSPWGTYLSTDRGMTLTQRAAAGSMEEWITEPVKDQANTYSLRSIGFNKFVAHDGNLPFASVGRDDKTYVQFFFFADKEKTVGVYFVKSGKWLNAVDNKHEISSGAAVGPWEHWTSETKSKSTAPILNISDMANYIFTLKSQWGTYLAANNSSTLFQNGSSAAGPSEEWIVESVPGQAYTYSLRNVGYNKYVTFDGDHPLAPPLASVGRDDRSYVQFFEFVEGATAILSIKSGRWLNAVNDKQLIYTGDGPGPWEHWNLDKKSHSVLNSGGLTGICDFVVAVDQGGMRTAVGTYLTHDYPPVEVLLLKDSTGKLVTKTKENFIHDSGIQFDPFDVPNHADLASDVRIQALQKAKFIAAVKVTPGVPDSYSGHFVTLKPNENSVSFDIICKEFAVAYLSSDGNGAWMNVSQPADDPWILECKVGLRDEFVDLGQIPGINIDPSIINSGLNVLRPLIGNLDLRKFGLRNDKQLSNLLTAVSRLSFGQKPKLKRFSLDFSNPSGLSFANLNSLKIGDGERSMLQKLISMLPATWFFDSLSKPYGIPPVVGFVLIPQGGDVHINDVKIRVGSRVDQRGNLVKSPTDVDEDLTTLDFLFTFNQNPMNTSIPFRWNWLDEGDSEKGEASHGVMVIQRDSIVQYLLDRVVPFARNQCRHPQVGVDVHTDWLGTGHLESGYRFGFEGLEQNRFEVWSLSQNPKAQLNYPDIFRFHYESGAGDDKGEWGSSVMNTSYDLYCAIDGVEIRIWQHQKVVVSVNFFGGSSILGPQVGKPYSGQGMNVLDRTVMHYFTVAVNGSGNIHITAEKNRTSVDDKPVPDNYPWFGDLKSKIDDYKAQLKNAEDGISMDSLAQLLNLPNAATIPGGDVFTFRNAIFSSHQDLVAEVTFSGI
ncbi:hypothetical protein BJ742DRAFT_872055 [Cladochytrium replicatum]|nr:hypothetical protein BJ742DRAFT_872055 [Cladochytrium replicatum]